MKVRSKSFQLREFSIMVKYLAQGCKCRDWPGLEPTLCWSETLELEAVSLNRSQKHCDHNVKFNIHDVVHSCIRGAYMSKNFEGLFIQHFCIAKYFDRADFVHTECYRCFLSGNWNILCSILFWYRPYWIWRHSAQISDLQNGVCACVCVCACMCRRNQTGNVACCVLRWCTRVAHIRFALQDGDFSYQKGVIQYGLLSHCVEDPTMALP